MKIRYVCLYDIAKSKDSMWDKNRTVHFKDLPTTMRKYDYPDKSSLPLLIFKITLDLILKDIIINKCTFKMPHILGGSIGIRNISKRGYFNKNLFTCNFYKFVLMDFCKYGIRNVYKMKFSGKYKKLFNDKVNLGYKYQQRDDKQ